MLMLPGRCKTCPDRGPPTETIQRSDTHRRTDSYGNVRGLGTIQRMKLWRDRYSNFHYLTFYANHRRRWKEYAVHDFDAEFRQRDDRHRRLQLNARGARRASASESSHGHGRERRFSASSIFRPRNGGPSSAATQPTGELRYLGIQFTRSDRAQPGNDDYRRFIDLWNYAHDSDVQFDAPPSRVSELESPVINGMSTQNHYVNGAVAELPSPDILPTVEEPADYSDAENTP
jgi:hypothetical protein